MQPLLIPYMQRYPRVQVELVTEARMIDIVRDGYDAGFRTTDIVPGDMVAVPLGPHIRHLVVGSPSYFARHGRPENPGDLARHVSVRARMASGHIYHWEFERHGEALSVDVPGVVTLDEPHLLREAALAGLGLVYLSEYDVEADIAAGRLESVPRAPPRTRHIAGFGRPHQGASLGACATGHGKPLRSGRHPRRRNSRMDPACAVASPSFWRPWPSPRSPAMRRPPRPGRS
jgi:DNA-binding transcriptional LysR family regulator